MTETKARDWTQTTLYDWTICIMLKESTLETKLLQNVKIYNMPTIQAAIAFAQPHIERDYPGAMVVACAATIATGRD